VMVG
jgi:GTPase SAR1 family protein